MQKFMTKVLGRLLPLEKEKDYCQVTKTIANNY